MKKLCERKILRKQWHDYNSSSWYFITMCVQDRKKYFGHIKEGLMIQSPAGKIAHRNLQAIPDHFAYAKIYEFIVMPDHLHLIIEIPAPAEKEADRLAKAHLASKQIIPKIIQQYKSSVTKEINRLLPGVRFTRLRSYHDHIIFDEYALANMRRYIINNPRKRQEKYGNSTPPKFAFSASLGYT